jgi:sugar phosphate isomerase/epimerase
MNRSRCSLNQYTVRQLSLLESADACVKASIPAIGVWRDKLAELGLERASRELQARNLHVSSLCRGGFFPYETPSEKQSREDDNRRAIEEAAAIDAAALVLVCGPAPPGDLARARAQIEEGITMMIPDARAAGVRLAIEPLHPMLVAERSAITTLSEANDLAERLDPPGVVGVIVDAYHVFWDVRVKREIARAGRSIFGYHVSDWVTPNGASDIAASRAMMGDGCIDLHDLSEAVTSAGYDGDVEVEVLNSNLWGTDAAAVTALAMERFERFV